MSIIHIAFYPSDWLAGTRGLSAEESGVYITLVCRMYEMAGPIERDDDRLHRLCGTKSKAAFVRTLDYLISEGKIIEVDGGLFNERCAKEIENVTEKSSKAKAAAQSRWNKKPNKNKTGDNADASPKHMLEGCQSESESDIEEETKVSSLSSGDDKAEKLRAEIDGAVTAYNIAATESGWPNIKVLSKARRSALAARLRESGGIDGWRAALTRAQASNHCNGQNSRGWVANFDFLVRQSSFAKLMEGNYDNRQPADRKAGQYAHADSRLRRIITAAAEGTSGRDWG